MAFIAADNVGEEKAKKEELSGDTPTDVKETLVKYSVWRTEIHLYLPPLTFLAFGYILHHSEDLGLDQSYTPYGTVAVSAITCLVANRVQPLKPAGSADAKDEERFLFLKDLIYHILANMVVDLSFKSHTLDRNYLVLLGYYVFMNMLVPRILMMREGTLSSHIICVAGLWFVELLVKPELDHYLPTLWDPLPARWLAIRVPWATYHILRVRNRALFKGRGSRYVSHFLIQYFMLGIVCRRTTLFPMSFCYRDDLS